MSALILRIELWVDRQGSSSWGEDCLVWAPVDTQQVSAKFYVQGDSVSVRAMSRDTQPNLCRSDFLQGAKLHLQPIRWENVQEQRC